MNSDKDGWFHYNSKDTLFLQGYCELIKQNLSAQYRDNIEITCNYKVSFGMFEHEIYYFHFVYNNEIEFVSMLTGELASDVFNNIDDYLTDYIHEIEDCLTNQLKILNNK